MLKLSLYLIFSFFQTLSYPVNGVWLNGQHSRFRSQRSCSNPGWFAVLNSNLKLSAMWYSSKYNDPAGTPLKMVINSHLRMHLQIWRQSANAHNAQLVYLNCQGSLYPTPFIGRYCTGLIRRMLNRGGSPKHENC